MRTLLDVNVWVALFDDAHQFSAQANAFIATPGVQIATCPLTENGVVRVLSLPAYSRRGGLTVQVVRQRLQQACAQLDHAFWPDSLSLRDDARFDLNRIQGHNQITDMYLLALAVTHGGRLASFDRSIALACVPGATPDHLLLL
jgi:toxin-antitoxin system PIN domain toxin